MPYLTAMARKLTGNRHDASDLVQDALVRALRALPAMPPDTDLRPWVATIVRHLHVDRVRQLAREPMPVPLEEASPMSLTAEQDSSRDEDGQLATARLDHLEHLDLALAQLPEDFRRVFVLHEIEGQSYRTIADALQIPIATVGTRLSRARLKLRELLARETGRT